VSGENQNQKFTHFWEIKDMHIHTLASTPERVREQENQESKSKPRKGNKVASDKPPSAKTQ
jgi:hypothetical protein